MSMGLAVLKDAVSGRLVPICLEQDDAHVWRWYEVATDRDMGVGGNSLDMAVRNAMAEWGDALTFRENVSDVLDRIVVVEDDQYVKVRNESDPIRRVVVVRNGYDALSLAGALIRLASRTLKDVVTP